MKSDRSRKRPSPRGLEGTDSGFLDLPEAHRRAESSLVHVLPAPLEETVSYAAGTRAGPQAIIVASRQVELYDGELGGEPALGYGIHTLPAVSMARGDIETSLGRIERSVADILAAGKLPVLLGGEHTVTLAAVRALSATVAAHPARPLAGRPAGSVAGPLVVVQLDAHADLRETFLGKRLSHACVMRRILEETRCELFQVATRSMSAEEAAFIEGNSATVHAMPADRIAADRDNRWLEELAQGLRGKRVWLSIDVDGLDPTVVPATGTPEPGGLSWWQALRFVTTVARSAQVAGIDCVELAPRPGFHAAAFTVAKLLYWTMSRIVASKA